TLTAAQRAKILRAIVLDRGASAPNGEARTVEEPHKLGDPSLHSLPAPSPADLAVGAAIPETLPLRPLPDSVGVEVAAVRHLSYVAVGGRLLLVDPDTNVAVAEISR